MPGTALRIPRLLRFISSRYREERCPQIAAALSFTTLLALVPLVAIGVALMSHLPAFDSFGRAFEALLVKNVLPDKAGGVVAKYLVQFSHKAQGLTLAGSALLAATAVMLMLTIDHTFNAIWRVQRPRPLWRRLLVYSVALAAGPIIVAMGVGALSYVITVSLGLVDEPLWVRAALFRFLAGLVLAGLLTLLYYAVPNRPVRLLHALSGGVLAAAGLIGLQRLVGLYVAKVPAYSVIYGAFSAAPVFLLWLFAGWTVVLLGALIVAGLGEGVSSGRGPAGTGKVRRRRSARPG